MKTYNVDGLDADGCTLVRREAYTLKEARKEMRLMLADGEYLYSGLVRVTVSDDATGECLEDKRAYNTGSGSPDTKIDGVVRA